MKKQLTDEQLEKMGRLTKVMQENAKETWAIALKTLVIGSSRYKKVCTAGNAIEKIHHDLRVEALDRGWSEEKMQDVFSFEGISYT